MVYVSCVSAYKDFIGFGLNDRFVVEASPDCFEGLVVVVCFRVAYDAIAV